MKFIAAYLLAVLGGNTSPSSDQIKDILGSVGIEADYATIEFFLSEVRGKDITELIAAGREKFASVPTVGDVVVVAAPVGGGVGEVSSLVAAEPMMEEKEESDDEGGLGGLFD